jgi:hypothetical protein
LSRAKRLSSPFSHQKLPQKQKRPADSSGPLSYKKEFATAVKYFRSPNFIAQSCLIAARSFATSKIANRESNAAAK